MPFLSRFIHQLLISIFFGIICLQSQIRAEDWPEITDEEWALSEPKIDPNAGAEYLLREIYANDRAGSSYNFHYRIKVFSQKGVDRLKTIRIPTDNRGKISKIQARVIDPDGTVNEVEREAIYSRKTIKNTASYRKRRLASFSLPGLKPGCIIDYKFTIKPSEGGFRYLYGSTIYAHADYPTHKLIYTVKPYERLGAGVTSIGIPPEAFQEVGSGTRSLELENLPAYKDDLNQMPPPSLISPWLAFYYLPLHVAGERNSNELFWKNAAKEMTRWSHDEIITKGSIKEKAQELTKNAESPIEKLKLLYDFCQNEIDNTNSDLSRYSYEELEKMPTIKSAADVLKYGFGNDDQVNFLFGSLAESIGFDVTIARINDRTHSIFEKTMLYWSAIPDVYIAIKSTKDENYWDFYSPGTPYLSFGQVRHENEGTIAFLAENKKPVFFPTKPALSENSETKRIGDFKLDSEGNLNGEVSISFFGHIGRLTKEYLDDLNLDERIDWAAELVTDNFGQATVSEVEIMNLESHTKTLKIKFKVEIPQFAEQTPSRLFFEPSIFTHGSRAAFPEETREYPIYFDVLPNEFDQYTFIFPEGYELEPSLTPKGAIDIDAIKHQIIIGTSRKSGAFIFRREFVVNAIIFNTEYYSSVKAIFDEVNKQDHYLLALKKSETD